jgi:N-acetylglucosaminyldiphosphoundecaprenol N-acetyl-beta-D-mannosaminyltransferase
MVTPDGVPLVWLGRLKGRRHMTRVYGPDLMLEVCRLSNESGGALRHFFYGAAPGVAEELGRRLAARFPGLIVAGSASPPFRDLSVTELEADAETINASAADIVWVGLGTPKQERWAAAMRGRLRAKVLVTVGAAFDIHAGRLRQAPRSVQRAGLEWAYRLLQEPRRLWRRYLTNNSRFIVLAAVDLLGLSKNGVASEG